MKRRKKKGASIVRIILTVILGIILFASSFLSVVLTVSKFTVFNYGFYKRIILTDEYYSEIKKEIETDIDGQGVSRIFTELSESDKQDLKDSIKYDSGEDDSVRAYSEAFLRSIVQHIKTGSEIEPVDYQNDAYRSVIGGIINSFAESVDLEDAAELKESADYAYNELRHGISSQIQIIDTEYWNKLPALAGVNKAADLFYIPIILTVIAAIVIRLVYFKKKTLAYYHMLFPMWFASLIFFVPSVMLSIYDIPKRIRASVLAASSPIINIYIGNFLTNFAHLLLAASLVLFALLTILLLLAILTNANQHGNRYKRYRIETGSSSSDDYESIDLVL